MTAAKRGRGDLTEHGTYGGYQRCRKRPEKACPACLEANNAYVREWRRVNKPRHAEFAANQAARDRALRALARLHPVEFASLYEAELGRLQQGDTP